LFGVREQVIVAARELPTGSLTDYDLSFSDELTDSLNVLSELRHPSILPTFGVVNPASVPTLVSKETL